MTRVPLAVPLSPWALGLQRLGGGGPLTCPCRCRDPRLVLRDSSSCHPQVLVAEFLECFGSDPCRAAFPGWVLTFLGLEPGCQASPAMPRAASIPAQPNAAACSASQVSVALTCPVHSSQAPLVLPSVHRFWSLWCLCGATVLVGGMAPVGLGGCRVLRSYKGCASFP